MIDRIEMGREKWLPIPGYEDHYEVSNFGRVKSLSRVLPSPRGGIRRLRERLLKLRKQRSGHLHVVLFLNGERNEVGVHRLVLLAFVGPCPEGMECCHFPDRNPANNHLDNLRWDTRVSNSADMTKHGTRVSFKGTAHTLAKLNDDGIRRIRELMSEPVGTRLPQKKIAKMFGVCQMTISRIKNGLRWRHVI